ncbi:unnamed protein product [Ixodes persulcatus]
MKCHLVVPMQRHTTRSAKSVPGKKPLASKKLKADKRMLRMLSASLLQLPEEFVPEARQQLECRENSFKTGIYRTLMLHQETHKRDRRLKCRFCDYITRPAVARSPTCFADVAHHCGLSRCNARRRSAQVSS